MDNALHDDLRSNVATAVLCRLTRRFQHILREAGRGGGGAPGVGQADAAAQLRADGLQLVQAVLQLAVQLRKQVREVTLGNIGGLASSVSQTPGSVCSTWHTAISDNMGTQQLRTGAKCNLKTSTDVSHLRHLCLLSKGRELGAGS